MLLFRFWKKIKNQSTFKRQLNIFLKLILWRLWQWKLRTTKKKQKIAELKLQNSVLFHVMLNLNEIKKLFILLRYNHFTSHNYIDEMTKKNLSGNQLFSIFTTKRIEGKNIFAVKQEDNIERLSFLMRNGVYITDWNHCVQIYSSLETRSMLFCLFVKNFIVHWFGWLSCAKFYSTLWHRICKFDLNANISDLTNRTRHPARKNKNQSY